GAPGRQHLSIGAELNNARVALIDDVDGVIGANSDPARSIKSRFRAFPLRNESAVRGQLLHTVIASVRYVHIALAINGDPVWCSELSIAGSLHSYGADESAGPGKLLDPSITSVGDQSISLAIDRDSRRRR